MDLMDADLEDNNNDAAPAPIPRKQKFHNLEEVTDENNYDELPPQRKKTYTYKNARGTFTMGYTTVKENSGPHTHPRDKRNALKNAPGPRTREAKRVTTPEEAFNLFIPHHLLNDIVGNTNAAIDQFLEQHEDLIRNSDKYVYYNVVDLLDVKAFFGLLYMRARFKVNLMDRKTIWHHEVANDFFQATMSLNRFVFISRFLTFDEKTTREERWMKDKFACMRVFFESVNENNAKHRYPSEYMAIDEILYPYRGRIGFKQCNPNKPAKYGLLYRSLCDASVPYTYFNLPYAGKPEDRDEGNPLLKYSVAGTDDYSKYLVQGFCNHNAISGCNISMDRFFTSVTLAQWSNERNFIIAGTMRVDRVGIPQQVKDMNNRDEKSTMYVYTKDEDMLLVSYVDKKNRARRMLWC